MDFMAYRNDTGWVRPYLGPGESILWQGRPQRFTPFTVFDAYVITTQKILRRRGKKADLLQGYSMPPMQVKEHRDGLKSILFGQSSFFQTNGVKRMGSFGEPGFALEFLSDAERALRAINSIRVGFPQQ